MEEAELLLLFESDPGRRRTDGWTNVDVGVREIVCLLVVEGD